MPTASTDSASVSPQPSDKEAVVSVPKKGRIRRWAEHVSDGADLVDFVRFVWRALS